MHLKLKFWIFSLDFFVFYNERKHSRISPIFHVHRWFWTIHKNNLNLFYLSDQRRKFCSVLKKVYSDFVQQFLNLSQFRFKTSILPKMRSLCVCLFYPTTYILYLIAQSYILHPCMEQIFGNRFKKSRKSLSTFIRKRKKISACVS